MAAKEMNADERHYGERLEPHRRELQVHCYRMLGSGHDAEDAVQETLTRGWRGLGRFGGRRSLRAWLSPTAATGSRRLIGRRPARGLPMDWGLPAHPYLPLGPPVLE